MYEYTVLSNMESRAKSVLCTDLETIGFEVGVGHRFERVALLVALEDKGARLRVALQNGLRGRRHLWSIRVASCLLSQLQSNIHSSIIRGYILVPTRTVLYS